MTFDALAAVGLLSVTTDDGSSKIAGSCFLFRQDHVALTAAHCIPDGAVTRVEVRSGIQAVTHVERHPHADLAAVYLDTPGDDGEGYPKSAFWNEVGNWGLGEEFMAFGYPTEGPTPDAPGLPVPRLFTGHYQRFLRYASSTGRQYLAGEMSIPAPAGLSGAPLFRPGAHSMVTGLVTTNLESFAVTDSFEEVRDGGSVRRVESRRVINYGLALMLSDVSDWLNQFIPHRKGTAYNP